MCYGESYERRRLNGEENMKSAPAPKVPGHTPWERFDNAVGKLLSVPKEAFLKEEAKLKRLKERGGLLQKVLLLL